MSKVKCPECNRKLGEPTGSIWMVEWSTGAEVKEPHPFNVYKCLSCKIDIVFLAKSA